jgi:predicted DNA binding CopG/RHH family protein
MQNAKKIHISLNNEILEKGKANAREMGIPFSTYLSILISNDKKVKRKEKQ